MLGTSEDGFIRPRWMQAMGITQSWSCPMDDIRIEGTHDGRPFEIFARFELWKAHRDFLKNDTASDTHIRSPLLARAWDFQELYLSPRTIHLHSSVRLPALAGLASQFQEQTTGDYFADLWQNDLVRMLLWCLKDSTVGCTRSRQSAAPSWSWASIVDYDELNGRGDNPPSYILVQRFCTSFKHDTNAEILKVEYAAAGINPFGQVSMGTILIRGTIVYSTVSKAQLLGVLLTTARVAGLLYHAP
ncbi:uncharacterized protein BP5553_02309 [Venustampulla echinocandica]|uniref:Heterokaryon incompatibility domain-containing protein n=1 Tax=Venustampulla echinocandica TaxID=2656787 RepID=A0A370U3H8_9HELO|nr:uncharacterized protein BP5553_02309 [Venustampulla echinocandica]RDL42330.1 hypothetical protein BP5553_02309 [Venustampulla echinocandica]